MGTGKQKIPAVANFIGYYCIGLTLGVTLMFVTNLRIIGDYLGRSFSVVVKGIQDKIIAA